MNDGIDMTFDRDLRDLFERGPRRAPATTLAAAAARAAAVPQRRPISQLLDRRAWPPKARSASDPSVHRLARLAAVAALVLLVGAAIAVGARLLDRPPSVRLEASGALPDLLLGPTASLWPDGRILVQGQSGARYLFDPASGASERLRFDGDWALAAAQVLPDGRVILTVSPEGSGGRPKTVDVAFYDPATRDIRPAGSYETPWSVTSQLVLRDGRILLSGGVVFREDVKVCGPLTCEVPPTPAPTAGSDSTEGAKSLVWIFDPATGASADVGHLVTARFGHRMLELDDGRILIMGGGTYANDTITGGEAVELEVLDLTTGSTKVVGGLDPAHYPGLPRGIRLANGRILIQGQGLSEYPCGLPSLPASGSIPDPIRAVARQATYIFDPSTDRIIDGPVMPHFYGVDNIVPLADGRAVAFGSFNVVPLDCSSTPSRPTPWVGVLDPGRNIVYESYDPGTGPGLLDVEVPRVYGAGVQLPDGRVALVGDDPDQREKNSIDLMTVGR